MAEGFRAAVSGESTVNGTDITVTLPATIQANDGLVAVYTVASTSATVSTPARTTTAPARCAPRSRRVVREWWSSRCRGRSRSARS